MNAQPNSTSQTQALVARVSITRSLFASSGRVSLYQCIGVLLAFGFQAFISRVCGADALGAVTLFLSWLGILGVLAVPGLEGSLIYFLPRFEGNELSARWLLRKCLMVAGVASITIAAVAGFAGPHLFSRIGLPIQARLAFCVAIVAYSVGKILDAVFLGLKEAPVLSTFNNIRIIARCLFCLPVLVFPSAGWTILFYAITAECLLAAFLRYVLLLRRHPALIGNGHFSGEAQTGPHVALAAMACPMLGIGIIDNVYPLLDKAVLGVMFPLALVGIYRIGDALANVNTMFVSPFVAFWPYISQLRNQDRLDELRESYKQITLFIIALMLPFSLLLVELSPSVLALFGPEFASEGRSIFLVLAFGSAIDAIAGPAGAVLKLSGHARLSLGINTAWLILFLGSTLLLTRHYGILGAAIAKALSTVLGNLANVTANRFLLGIFPYTARHAWLLLAAGMILCSRWLLFPACINPGTQFLCGMIESTVLIAFSAFLLRDEIRRIVFPQIRIWLEGGSAIHVAD